MCNRFRKGKIPVIGNIPFKSAPAQNALPLPVMIPTRSESSSSNHFHTLSSSMFPSELMQLSTSGLFNVTRSTRGAGKLRSAYFVFGGCVVNLGDHSELVMMN
jgi:hypothetical protein